MKKKILLGILAVVLLMGLLFLVGTGFAEREVYLAEYTVSEDGRTLTFSIGVPASMGYVRGFTQKQVQGLQYLTFYSTFGGPNSRFGAKHTFTLTLEEEDQEILFNDAQDGWNPVLCREELTGEWVRP